MNTYKVDWDYLDILFTRLSKEEFIYVANQMHVPLEDSMIRVEWIQKAKALYPDGLTLDQIAGLEIDHVQKNMNKKNWYAYKLNDSISSSKPIIDSEYIRYCIQNELIMFFNVHTYVCWYEDALWIRLSFFENDTGKVSYIPQGNDSIYITHIVGSDLILSTEIKEGYKQYIDQCICLALGRKSMNFVQLSGNDIQSLVNLINNKKCAGGLSSYKNQYMESPPLVTKVKHHNTTIPNNSSTVIMEDTSVISNNIKKSNYIFGEGIPDSIQSIKFNIHSHVPEEESNEYVSMEISMKGKKAMFLIFHNF
ncbi:hypothetical protein WA158_001435 [Blastocystis sp. Blastoise]